MKLYLAILMGLLVYALIGSLGLYLLKISCTAYKTASLDKSYTLPMLLARLGVALIAATATGFCGSLVRGDRVQCSWIAGIVIASFATYIHLLRVWTDYPLWYHLAYLLPIIPTIVYSHYAFERLKW